MKRTSIPDVEVFKAAIQDEISRTPKDATSIDSMLFSMSWMEPVPMIRLACMETLREPLNIGFKGLLLKDSLDCWMETIRDAQVGCPLRSWLNCVKISVVPLGAWVTTISKMLISKRDAVRKREKVRSMPLKMQAFYYYN